MVNLWRQAPSRRGLVLRRHSQSKLVGMMEHLVSILWAIATTTAVIGSWTTLVPLAAVAAVLALNRKWAAAAAPAVEARLARAPRFGRSRRPAKLRSISN
jgi:ABC-2 type transport system permease protein